MSSSAFPARKCRSSFSIPMSPGTIPLIALCLYPPSGRPVEVAPWRLALVMVMPYIEGLTDRQAADAVPRCMDWKYALSLDLTDPGFDFTLLHDFRHRLLAHEPANGSSTPSWPPQSARVDQSTGHATHRFHPCLGGDPHAAPLGMCPGSHALGAEPAERGSSRLGAPAGAAGWYTRMASGPTKPACRRTRVNARRLPARSGRTALSSWTGCGLRTPLEVCGSSLP